jgi:hypothetical protein
MKKSLVSFVAMLPMILLFLLNLTQRADAQASEATLDTLQICNTIMNMHDADPQNPELSMGRRECNARAYMVQLCASSTASAGCWDANYPNPVDLDNDDLITIIENNQ